MKKTNSRGKKNLCRLERGPGYCTAGACREEICKISETLKIRRRHTDRRISQNSQAKFQSTLWKHILCPANLILDTCIEHGK